MIITEKWGSSWDGICKQKDVGGLAEMKGDEFRWKAVFV